MTLSERWSVSSTWARVTQIVAALAVVGTLIGAGAGVDAWAAARVTTINQRVVPPIVRASVDDAIGGDLRAIAASIEELREAVSDVRAEQHEQRTEMRAIRRELRE